jgi:acetyl-CoA carboxylase beta subunit
MLKVKCPKCKKDQNYDPRPGQLSSKTKRCVYCGHTFKIYSDQRKNNIVRIVKIVR